MILVRDWSLDPSWTGFEGGAKHLKGKLESKAKGASASASKIDILDAFERKECFLMSYPGGAVASSGDSVVVRVRGTVCRAFLM